MAKVTRIAVVRVETPGNANLRIGGSYWRTTPLRGLEAAA